MDYSKLSDEALRQISSGKVDYSKLSNDDLAIISGKTITTPEISQTESGVRGAAQGASLGLADEITGGLGAAYDVSPFGNSPIDQLVERYRQNRDESRAAYDAAKKANPKTYLGGEIGGGLATMLVPGLGVAKGAKLAQAIKTGALAGGIAGFGGSNADLTKPDIGNYASAAGSTAGGAALGAGTAGLFHTVFNPSTAANDIAVAAAKEHLRATPKVAGYLGDELNNVAQESLQAGAIQPFSKAKDTAQRLENLVEEVGAVKGDAVNALSENGASVDPKKWINNLNGVADDLHNKGAIPEAKRLRTLIQEYADEYLGKGDIPLNKLENVKSYFQNRAKSAYQNRDVSDFINGIKGMAYQTKDLGEKAAGNVNNKQLLEQFINSKTSLSNLNPAEAIAERTGALTHGGLMPHVTDTGLLASAISSASHGNFLPALALPVRAATKGRVASTIAAGSHGLSKLLSKIPNPVGEYAAPVGAGAAKSTWEYLHQ